jgi:hypothetical protein
MRISTAIVVLALAWSGAAAADDDARCDTKSMSGRWLFATDVGHQMLLPGGDITAIGTMNISRDGELRGKFDATVQDWMFLPGNDYFGSIVVGPDCTGTLTFETSQGTSRTDSIVVVSRKAFWAMSQDPNNLWTYRARRISGHR